ncbi:CatB-related O-acetyltransferase [Luteococcus sp. Sow4_B9]|uniref:CatB-related O-acetyltransferase n=1 Tax=Luteococcus sp. Sow4_B9 TaxID=3438792 RepID=UPI003F9AC1D4
MDQLRRQGRLEWGRATYGTPTVHTFEDDETRLVVGSFTSIAKDVSILLGGNHATDRGTTYPFRIMWQTGGPYDGFPSSKGDVVIGNDVWIGHRSTIVSGVTIGDGAIVAAGSLVVKDVPPYTICGGNPAKPLRSRFPQEIVDELLELRWWDLPDETIRGLIPVLSGSDTDALLAALRAARGL